MRYLPEDNLAYPVLIKIDNGSSGSGFQLRKGNEIYLITAKHVIFKQGALDQLLAPKGNILSYSKDIHDKQPATTLLDLAVLKSSGNIKVHPIADAIAIKVADLVAVEGQNYQQSVPVEGITIIHASSTSPLVAVSSEFLKKYDEVLVSNEVVILGYPNSLGTGDQIEYDRPLLRKGIIAGKNEKNKTIILDCPAYFGNSGGLVLEVEEVGLGQRKFCAIGIVTQFVPFVEQQQSIQYKTINTSYENSGYSIAVPIDTILDLIGS